MIQTRCKFYYGHTVTEENSAVNFEETPSVELTAFLNIGEYSITDYFTELARAMNEVGALDYSVALNRATRVPTLNATGTFKLRPVTGTNAGISALPMAGFTTDTGFAASHIANVASGYEWVPQFLPQAFVDFDQNQKAIDGVVRKTQSGKVEAVRFGIEYIAEMNFTFITNVSQSPDSPIENDPSGYENALAFMEYATTKADMEFIPDRDNADVFTKVILDSTPDSGDGLGFKLTELYDKGIPFYYETGVLKFRKLV